MTATLVNQLFDYWAKTHAFIVVGLELLLKFKCFCVFDVFTNNFKFLVSLANLKFQFPDLLFQRHDQESLLLVLLGSLSKRHQVLVRVCLEFSLSLIDDLIMAEEILDGLLFPSKFVFEDLDFCLELDHLFPHLVVQHLHFDCFVIELLFFLTFQSWGFVFVLLIWVC